MKQDIYQKVTDKIIADLEQGELSWLKPWSSGNLEGKITKPLRHNGVPYNGINILMLWGAGCQSQSKKGPFPGVIWGHLSLAPCRACCPRS